MTGDQTWTNPANDPPPNDLRPPAPPTTQLPLTVDALVDLRKFAVGVALELARADADVNLLPTAREIAEFVQHGTVPESAETEPAGPVSLPFQRVRPSLP